MTYAFDWANTLSNRRSLVIFAGALLAAGHQVYIVTANPDAQIDMRPYYENVGLAPTGCEVVLDDFNPLAVGERKAAVLQRIRADVFFDDVRENVEAAAKIGVRAIWVGPQFMLTDTVPAVA